MMVTVALFTLAMSVLFFMLFFANSSMNASGSESVTDAGAIAISGETIKITDFLQNLKFDFGGPGGPGGPGPFGGPRGPGGPMGYGGPGPGYGPFYGGGYSGPYGGGGYIGPYGPWVGGPGAGGYGQYNPYYGPNGFGPTGNSAAGHGSMPKVPGRPEKYGFFQRLRAFVEHWFG